MFTVSQDCVVLSVSDAASQEQKRRSRLRETRMLPARWVFHKHFLGLIDRKASKIFQQTMSPIQWKTVEKGDGARRSIAVSFLKSLRYRRELARARTRPFTHKSKGSSFRFSSARSMPIGKPFGLTRRVSCWQVAYVLRSSPSISFASIDPVYPASTSYEASAWVIHY
jgi:hypothetical protein